MFAYCGNNPVNNTDINGYMMVGILQNRNIADGGFSALGSSPGHIVLSDSYNFSVMEETYPTSTGSKIAQLFSGEIDLFSLSEASFELVSFNLTAFSLDLDSEPISWSLFDLGSVNLTAGICAGKPRFEAMISLWSPSVSFMWGDRSVTLTALIGSWGGGLTVSTESVKIGYANIIGASISIS